MTAMIHRQLAVHCAVQAHTSVWLHTDREGYRLGALGHLHLGASGAGGQADQFHGRFPGEFRARGEIHLQLGGVPLRSGGRRDFADHKVILNLQRRELGGDIRRGPVHRGRAQKGKFVLQNLRGTVAVEHIGNLVFTGRDINGGGAAQARRACKHAHVDLTVEPLLSAQQPL